MKRICTILLVLLAGITLTHTARAQGVPAKAFQNVTIHKADGTTIDDAVIVWRDGMIEAAGEGVEIPFDAEVWDGGDSLHVYPGFIDGNAYWGSPDRKRFEDTPQRRGEPSYERAGIRPERHAREAVNMESDDFETALKNGFTTAALATKGYMIPGQLDLFFLHPELQVGDLYEAGVGMQMQFQESFRVYPSTVMGIMARLQQLVYDAQALRQQQRYYAEKPNQVSPPENSPTLQALYPVLDGEQRVFFKVDSKEMIERVFQLQDQIGFEAVIVSGMEAYKVADELNRRDIPVLASIAFPEKPEWKADDYEEKGDVSDEMEAFRARRWSAFEKRYKNIRSLMDAGVDVGFATADLELKDLSKRMKEWDEYGDVDSGQILKVMTINTAAILNKSATLGEVESGKVASFSVMSKPFMEEKAAVVYSVSEGAINEFND